MNKKVLLVEDPLSCRHAQSKIEYIDAICLFCDKSAGSEGLYNASTHDTDRNVCRCALELNDTAPLAKLVPADMIALEVKYHTKY